MQLLEKDLNELVTHLRQHVTYPAAKAQITASFKGMAHLSKEAVEWAEKMIPDRTYQTADEVITATNLKREQEKTPA